MIAQSRLAASQRRRRRTFLTIPVVLAMVLARISSIVVHGFQQQQRLLNTRSITKAWAVPPTVINGDGQQRRLYSRDGTTETPTTTSLSFAETPLGKNGNHLLQGLDVYSVPASDGHPLAVYGIQSKEPVLEMDNTKKKKPILLLHGRTWSSVPVYHLMGWQENKEESRSTMETLLSKGLQPYCFDFRGFGGTPDDPSGHVEPARCVEDAERVLNWIQERHGDSDEPPALLGWSQGALVAQMAAQKHTPALSKLILYGSIYDPLIRYPREPLYRSTDPSSQNTPRNTPNDFDDAISDFTIEGTIPPEPARLFAEAALVSDPIKAHWHNLYQFNTCDPARVHVPCLVVAGDQDPYAPLHVQQELFCALGRASDRTWSILSESDHAVHLLDGRERLLNTVVSFVQNGKRSEQAHQA